jgi:uncharacterized protein
MVSGEKRQMAIRPGYFDVPAVPTGKPRLIGARCRICGDYYFAKRLFCLACGSDQMEECSLTPGGKVWSYTVSHVVPPGALVTVPYIVALLQAPEGPVFPTELTGVDVDNVKIGMDAELYVEKVAEDAEGNELMVFKARVI